MFARSLKSPSLETLRKGCLSLVWTAGFAAFASFASLAPAQAGTVIYVSPTVGNDNNPGTSDAPLGSIAAAVEIVQPGDTIILAAGTYNLNSKNNIGIRIRRDGTKAAPITLRSQGGEAILDCSGLTSRKTAYCFQLEADWWRISGIAVTGARQNSKEAWAVGVNLLNASNNILKSVRSFRNQGPGISIIGKSSNNLLQDCESFSNYDPLARIPGGNADGVQVSSIGKAQVGNMIANCFSHNNSDDGFDLWASEAAVTISNSTSSGNGYIPGTRKTAGDGVGFKLGKNSSGPRHRIINNHAINNRAAGFDRNGAAKDPIYVGNVSRGNLGGDYK